MRALALPPVPRSIPTSSEIDWRLTIIAAFSLLLHFGVAAGLFSDWMDRTVDDGAVVGGVLEVLPPIAAPIETPRDGRSGADDPATGEPRATKVPHPVVDRIPHAAAPRADAARLGDVLQRIAIDTLGVLRDAGPATGGVLKRGSVPTDALDAIAAKPDGVERDAVGGLRLGAGGRGPLGQHARGLAQIGDTRRTTPSGAGPGARVEGPKVIAEVAVPDATATGVPGVERVVAGLRGAFRRCYRAALDGRPDAHGSVRIVAKIGPNGEVVSTTPYGGGDLGPSLVGCLARHVRGATFAAPRGGAATIVIPITFALQP